MSQDHEGDLIDADRYAIDELRAAAFGKSETMSRQLAVSLLGRKEYPDKVKDFAGLLQNDDEEPRLRIMAATELGRIRTEPAMRKLKDALEVKEPRVLQSVVEAAAAAGDIEAMDRIRTLRRRSQESLAKTAEWGAELLALLSEGRSQRLPKPERRRLMTVDRKRAESANVRTMQGSAAAGVVEEVSTGPLNLDLTTEAAARVNCGQRVLGLLFTRSFLADMSASLQRKSVAMAVAERDTVETETWELRYFVVTQPGDEDVEIHVLTQRGELAFFGHASEREGRVGFSIQTVDRPGAVPAVVEGSFDGSRISVDRFVSELTGRRRTSPGVIERSQS